MAKCYIKNTVLNLEKHTSNTSTSNVINVFGKTHLSCYASLRIAIIGFLFIFLGSNSSYGQNITTGTIAPLTHRAGNNISVPYTKTGNFNPGNVFTAQLSNASGSFASPVNIGTLTSTAAGTISATIPVGTVTGSGYRIRVISSNPGTTGTINGSNITINASPAVPTATGAFICIGSTATLSASGAVDGEQYVWYDAATGGTMLKTSTNNADNTYTTPTLAATTNYWVSIKIDGVRTQVTATSHAPSADNENDAGTNSWIGHVYDGIAFNTYYGRYTEAEIFYQSFGNTYNCFSITSNAVSRTIYTETMSIRYRMNSTRRGLYVANLGSDDGSRLTVDGMLLYNNWSIQGFATKERILMNLTGASSLVYDYYEDVGGNAVQFFELTPVLANNLTANTTQSIALGNSGTAISGDVYGALPIGISLSGTTGYQWVYSTTPEGPRTNIPSATGATFTPNTTLAPFNVGGTYYIYRKALLSSTNNYGFATYIATNESNAATVVVGSIITGTITPLTHRAGNNVSVPFTTGTLNLGNVFTAQLSDASGSFASPVAIGTLNSTVAGTISATIPVGTVTGSGYRIRVISSNPSSTGTINGSNITINASPAVPTTTGAFICIGSTATLSASGAVDGEQYVWYNAATGGTLLKTSTNNADNTYTTPALVATTNYWVSIKIAGGTIGSRTQVTATFPATSADNQNDAGTNSWIGHVYDGIDHNTYYGRYTELETFNQSFGDIHNCFSITSNAVSRTIYTETMSIRYRMNSTRRGLHVANLGSDDGGRLTVDGTLLYNNWIQQGFNIRPRILMNLTGASSLVYDYFEDGSGNIVEFSTLTLVLANNLTANTTQSISLGNSGTAISGDVYGTLPAGISLSGTGYQWVYSTTPGGARTNISGATGATYTPNITVAPFNISGTYYIYRNAVLSSTNNVAPNPYIATNESNAATLTVSVPTIVVSPSCLTGFKYIFGFGPSAQQSFTVNGSNLIANITVTPSTNYEISTTSGSGFQSTPITLIQSGGIVAPTPVYVRLKAGLIAGNYNSESITSTSTSAVTKNVVCNGTVNTPTITTSVPTLTGFIYPVGFGPSAEKWFTVSGNNLVDNIKIYPSAKFEISTGTGVGFVPTSIITLPVSSGTVNSTTIYVRMKTGLSLGIINAENIASESTGATTKNVASSGTIVTAPLITTTPISGTFSYIFGLGPSASKTFSVSGTNLGGSVVITPPANYEISSNGGTNYYSTPITLGLSSGTPALYTGVLNATTITVRLKIALGTGSYSENVVVTSKCATLKNVALTGTVAPKPTIVSPSCLTGFNYIFGFGPSAQQSFTVSGSNLIANIIVTPSTNYEISTTSGSGFQSTPITLIQSGGIVAPTPVYVRLKAGLIAGNYSESIASTSTSADTKNVVCNGTVNTPTITTSVETLTGFIYPVGFGPSAEKRFTVSGTNLVDNIKIYPSAKFEISTGTGVGFVPTSIITLPVSSGTVNSTTIYVRMKTGLSLGIIIPENIASESTGATTKNVACSGTIVTAPLITTTPISGAFSYIFGLGPSASKTFSVSGTNLCGSVVITPPANYEISSDGGTNYYSTPITLGLSSGNPALYTGVLNATTITVRLKIALGTGSYSENVVVTSTKAVSTNVALSGSVVLNFWLGSVDTDWGNPANWTANAVPLTGSDIEFATIANFGATAINDLQLDLDRAIGSLINATTKRLVIPTGKGLTVNNTITTDGNASRIYIQASNDGSAPNGSLIFHNDVLSPVYGTVEMYNKASIINPAGSTTSPNNYRWQYFGTPVSNQKAQPTFDGSYVRRWNTADSKWILQRNDSVILPFIGYEIAQPAPKKIFFAGKLVNSNFSTTLNYNGVIPNPGQYLFSNPYTAAIDITQLEFGAGIDNSVFLFNTGSSTDWAVNGGSYAVSSLPGQYVVCPKVTAGNGLIPGEIVSMQGFMVKDEIGGVDNTFGIPYSAVIKNSTIQRVIKQRNNSNNSATGDKVMTTIDIKGTNFADRMWLFTDSTCTRGFDNGWDGRKILGSVLAPQLYAKEADGDYQIHCLSNVDNTTLAFLPGMDTQYTLTFTHQNTTDTYGTLYLIDLLENITTDITQSGTQYSFTSTSVPGSQERFKIVATNNITTRYAGLNLNGIQITARQNRIIVHNTDASPGLITVSDLNGRIVQNAKINGIGITTLTTHLAYGCYIVKAKTVKNEATEKIILNKVAK